MYQSEFDDAIQPPPPPLSFTDDRVLAGEALALIFSDEANESMPPMQGDDENCHLRHDHLPN